MEKAKVVMFFPKVVYGSVDVCGRIGSDGVDREITNSLKSVDFLDDMREAVEHINYKYYGIKHKQTTYQMTESFKYDELLDMAERYDAKYGTTWLFIKNMSCRTLEIRGADNELYRLPYRSVCALYCGVPCDVHNNGSGVAYSGVA